MIRLHFVVEGQTEETFVNAILRAHLVQYHVVCDARCVLTSRQGYKQFKGGVSKYGQIRRDISLWAKEDQNAEARFTTMFDLYGLPQDFPGRAEMHDWNDPYRKVERLERSMVEDLAEPRLIPYLQLHEFEALLFTDAGKLMLEFPAAESEIADLKELAQRYDSPELIDDRPEMAPSKRIIRAIPDYEGLKVTAGPRVAGEIGLPKIRETCAHFDSWLKHLEKLGS